MALVFSKLFDKKVKTNCKNCGKELILKPARLKRVKNIFCSKKCSDAFKERNYMGPSNPNFKYNFNREFFKKIDTEEKAYILGWIASDGHVCSDKFIISINKKDREILIKIKNIMKGSSDVKEVKRGKMVKFDCCSKEMSSDICSHLKINPGKKDRVVGFPDLNSDGLKWAFIRGLFDGDGGSVDPYSVKKFYPRCSIASYSKKMRDGIKEFCKIPCLDTGKALQWFGNNSIDFMGKLYDLPGYHRGQSLVLERKKELFFKWSAWVPSLSGSGCKGSLPKLTWFRVNKLAVPPQKSHASDSGFDLVLIEKVKQVGDLEYYTTGIKIRPDFGWYFDLVPRSSMPKTGYCIANDIGIIDRTYTGEIIAILRKFDKGAPNLQLPARCVQIIPRPIIHCEVIEVENLDQTDRGEGGFGSTGV
jgi:dUTP pyrophosphatase